VPKLEKMLKPQSVLPKLFTGAAWLSAAEGCQGAGDGKASGKCREATMPLWGQWEWRLKPGPLQLQHPVSVTSNSLS
jgi:hypothetical protein